MICDEEMGHEGRHLVNGPSSTSWPEEEAIGGRYDPYMYCPVCEEIVTHINANRKIGFGGPMAMPCEHPVIVKVIIRLQPNPLAAVIGVFDPRRSDFKL
jgi:hypothetical protein